MLKTRAFSCFPHQYGVLKEVSLWVLSKICIFLELIQSQSKLGYQCGKILSFFCFGCDLGDHLTVQFHHLSRNIIRQLMYLKARLQSFFFLIGFVELNRA